MGTENYDGISIWPSLGGAELVFILLAILLVVLTFLFTRKRYAQKERQSNYWHTIYQFALKRGLDKKELLVLKSFVDLYPKEKMADLLMSRRAFYAELFKFLRANQQIDAEIEVRILDKLFRSFDDHLQIKSVRDLQLGENVSLDYQGKHILCTVVSAVKGGVLLSAARNGLKPGQVSLYAFRPRSGGFSIAGKLLNSRSKGLHFQSDEIITARGDQHLMAMLELPATLSIWHSPNEAMNTDDSQEEQGQIKELKVITDRISDRAFMFEFAGSLDLKPIWQVELTLPDGFKLSCRGQLIAARRPNFFVFKFIDISPALRQALFTEIAENEPVREQFS